MEITIIGVAFLLLALFGLFVSVRLLVIALGLAIPMTASAAINLPAFGGLSVLCSSLIALALIGRTILEQLANAGRRTALIVPAACLYAAAIAGYGIFSALLFPRVFEGQTLVYTLQRDVSGYGSLHSGMPLVPLVSSTGNVSQAAYLASSCLLFICLYRVFSREHSLIAAFMGAVAVSHGFFGIVDASSVLLPVKPFLDAIRTANYAIIDQVSVAGMRRTIGAMPEASVFGATSAAIAAFYLFLSAETHRLRHYLAAALFVTLTLLSKPSVNTLWKM